jgi:GNAT superfamily N-acetyltransferase
VTLDEVAVGPAVPEDAAEVRRLSVSFTPSAENVPLEDFYSRFANVVSDASWCVAVAQSHGRLLGYGLAQDFGPGLRSTFTTGRVHDLFVDPDARRTGTGKALMDFIFSWASARPQAMILDWQASPSAVAFYEALGFTPDRIGDFPDYPGFTLDLRTGPWRPALMP